MGIYAAHAADSQIDNLSEKWSQDNDGLVTLIILIRVIFYKACLTHPEKQAENDVGLW